MLAHKKNIFLVGFMGAGKSTIGKKLARKLKFNFVDLDKIIEQKAQCSVNEIFKYLGEDAFRKMETECLYEFRDQNNFVMATGGGTPCFDNNLQFIKENGLSIYISLDVKTIHFRLLNAKNIRPSIKGLDGGQLLDFIEKNLSIRKTIYQQADIEMNGLTISIDQIESELQKINFI